MTTNGTLHHAMEAARRAGRWILERQRPDGSFFDVDAGVGGYYKAPAALGALGHAQAAGRLLRWVAWHHFVDGDFRAPQRKARGAAHGRWPDYANAWLALGAHRAGWFDLSFPAARRILTHQVPAGGFRAVDAAGPFLECVNTSWGALAVLTLGHQDAARRAGDCLIRLVEAQHDPDRFHFRMTIAGQIVRDVPAGAELGHFVDARQTQQVYYQPGIAMIFLCRLHLATGEPACLDAARRIFAFTQRCAADVYRFPPSGKLAVGCALLARITGEPEPAEAARQTIAWLLETQADDGHWPLPDVAVYAGIPDKQDPEVAVDLTAEFTAFICEIVGLL